MHTLEKGRARIRNVVFFGLALVGLSVFLDALIEARFDQKHVLSALFSPSFDELLIRLLLLVCELAFLFYIVYLLRTQNRLQNSLARALEDKNQAVARSDAVLEAFGDPVSIQDRELRVIYQNQGHRALMGDRVGEYCFQAYHKLDAVCPDCHLQAAFNDGQVHRRETSTQHSRRGEVQVEIVATPLFDGAGNIIAGIEAVRDISERKRNEAMIRMTRSTLEQRTAELSAANLELEAFGSSLAHDLRGHLTRIATAAEVLGAVDGMILGEDGSYCVQTIATATEEMDALIQSIMVLSRVSHRELEQKPVDLSALAHEVAESLRAADSQRPVEFAIASGMVAVGDRPLLKVALQNLIGNAWKYTRDRQPAQISLDCTDEDSRVVYRLRDNGIGFDMNEAGKLFLPFGRLSNGQNFPGLGIGLSTAQRVILRHGGEIMAESTPGAGTVFSFTLPK
jgi:signal transduction histidine kinase